MHSKENGNINVDLFQFKRKRNNIYVFQHWNQDKNDSYCLCFAFALNRVQSCESLLTKWKIMRLFTLIIKITDDMVILSEPVRINYPYNIKKVVFTNKITKFTYKNNFYSSRSRSL